MKQGSQQFPNLSSTMQFNISDCNTLNDCDFHTFITIQICKQQRQPARFHFQVFQPFTAHLAHIPPALQHSLCCYQFNSNPLGFPLTAPKLPVLRSLQVAHHRQQKGRSRQFSAFSSAEQNTLRLPPCETAFPDRDIPTQSSPFMFVQDGVFFVLFWVFFLLFLFAHHAPWSLHHAGTHNIADS